ncbi:MAG TPA: hypothetical protein VKP61_15095 [Candidatus Acidoferrum sp.]|nr:hypothetical protein [Candidatus Acidoferrum sp.]
MGAVIAIASIFGLLYAKHIATATASVPAQQVGGTAKITGSPDPSVAYDQNAPAQADAIGNTHLSMLDPVYTPGGDIVALPYRPSDLAYGGGVQSAVGTTSDANPAGSTGSGVSAIEALNAPHASAGLSRTASRLPTTGFFSNLIRRGSFVASAGTPNRGTGSGSVLKITNGVSSPGLGAVKGSGLPQTIAVASSVVSTPTTPGAPGVRSATPVARTNYLIAGRRLQVV